MDTETRRDLEATVAARRELGPEHEEHLIAGFLERIEAEIDRRVDERLARRAPRKLDKEALGIFVPIVIVAAIFAGSTGVIASLAAVVVVVALLSVSRR